jgi:hypothetical protein
MLARAHRLIGWGWATVLALALLSTTFAGEVTGKFGEGPVHVRPWMQVHDVAIGLPHLLAVALLWFGSLRLPSSRTQRVALGCFTLALVAMVAQLLIPVVSGGPWDPRAPEVRALRLTVFAPSALRAVGCAALAAVVVRSPKARVAICALLGIDAALVIWKWALTPKAVVAFIHPFCAMPIGLLPWVIASGVFFTQLGTPGRGRRASATD